MKPLLLLLFSMSASGSLAFLVYLIIVHFFRKSISAGFQYIALKFCLALFLIPFPLIKHLIFCALYPPALLFTNGVVVLDVAHSINLTSTGFFLYLSGLQKWLLFIWITLLLFITSVQLFRFLRLRKLITQNLHPYISHNALTTALNSEFQFRRPVQVYYCDIPLSPFTYGIFRPTVLLTPLIPENFRELALRHEFQHVKSYDFFYRLLLFTALLLHCFNPLIYIFFKEFMEVQEMHCDEKLRHSFSPEEKRQYGHMLIDVAASTQKAPVTAIAFSKTDSALIKKRIRRLTFPPHPQKRRLCLMLCLMLLCSSKPIYAYHPATTDFRNDSGAKTPGWNDGIDWISIELSTGTHFDYMPADEAAFASCDNYFLLEDGSILPLASCPPSPSAVCKHSYVAATYKEHLKKGNGCTVNIYNAQICTKCNSKKIGSLIGTNTYVKCPH